MATKPKKPKLDTKGYCLNDSTKVHPALEAYFGYCFSKAAVQLRAQLNEEFQKYGIIGPQFGILTVLGVSDSINQISLGEEMGIDKATMVKLIDGLERLGYVERTPNKIDRRIKLVKITSKGQAFSAKLRKHTHKIQERFLSPLTEEERKLLLTTIPKLLLRNA